jgi:PII-like signaling protein
VYVGRHARVSGKQPQYAICDLLCQLAFAGAIVLLGVDGTAHGKRCRAHFFSRNVNVPLMIIAIGSTAQVSTAATELAAVVPNPLLTVERLRLCKRDGELFARPQQLPIHRTLVQRLLHSDTARGPSGLRGIWGFHGDHKPHGDKLFQLARRVPLTTIIVDTPQSIARSFDIVDELTSRHGLVTSEMVPAALSLDETQRLGDITWHSTTTDISKALERLARPLGAEGRRRACGAMHTAPSAGSTCRVRPKMRNHRSHRTCAPRRYGGRDRT